MFIDQFKGFFDWRGDHADQQPRYGVLYLIIVPIVAATGIVSWLGWTWLALVLTALTVLLVGGGIALLSAKRYRKEQSQIPEWR